MSQVKNFQFQVGPHLKEKSAKEVLFLFFTEVRKIALSKRVLKDLIEKGNLRVNGKVLRFSKHILGEQDQVLMSIPRSLLKEAEEDIDIAFELTNEHVLFEDKHLIFVNKPSGLPSAPSLDPKRDHMYAAVKRYLQKQSPKEEIYCGLHHRLDVDTSGVMVFTKKRSVNKGIGNQFEFRQLQKNYLAVSYKDAKPPEKSFWIDNYLGRDKVAAEKKQLRICSVSSGGDPAKSFVTPLSADEILSKGSFSEKVISEIRSGDLVAFEVKPKTGRTHQIRVHLFEAGFPIIGDAFYFVDRSNAIDTRLHLHAHQLQITHPVTEEKLLISAPFLANQSLAVL